ncbi:MAG: hemolysin D [Flavobacteriales bacterium]|jgi:hemolysin D
MNQRGFFRVTIISNILFLIKFKKLLFTLIRRECKTHYCHFKLCSLALLAQSLLQQLQSTQQELLKVQDLNAKQVLNSPVEGRVKQLVVHTLGGVVSEAQVLMQIVPNQGYLEVEAVLQNKDVGFVHKGLKAEVKIHTFPFTKYGLVDAEVIDITADAIENVKQGLVYPVRLKVERREIWVDTSWQYRPMIIDK